MTVHSLLPVYNSLLFDIQTSTSSFNTFEKHLKSYLFKLSFSSL